MKKFLAVCGSSLLTVLLLAVAVCAQEVKTDYFTLDLPADWKMPGKVQTMPNGNTVAVVQSTKDGTAVSIAAMPSTAPIKDIATQTVENMKKGGFTFSEMKQGSAIPMWWSSPRAWSRASTTSPPTASRPAWSASSARPSTPARNSCKSSSSRLTPSSSRLPTRAFSVWIAKPPRPYGPVFRGKNAVIPRGFGREALCRRPAFCFSIAVGVDRAAGRKSPVASRRRGFLFGKGGPAVPVRQEYRGGNGLTPPASAGRLWASPARRDGAGRERCKGSRFPVGGGRQNVKEEGG